MVPHEDIFLCFNAEKKRKIKVSRKILNYSSDKNIQHAQGKIVLSSRKDIIRTRESLGIKKNTFFWPDFCVTCQKQRDFINKTLPLKGASYAKHLG